jgi:hypothetical protein
MKSQSNWASLIHRWQLLLMTHRVISLRCGPWSLSGHSELSGEAPAVTATTDFLAPDSRNKRGPAFRDVAAIWSLSQNEYAWS